ncbi:MAG TPA: hypothetical protein VGG12_07595 [Methylovirgula sp.]
MPTLKLEQRILLRVLLSIAIALLFIAATHRPVWAGEGHTFILPATDAYGASDCTGKTEGCSEVVASAYCESHGYASPIAYGKAGDMTGAIPATVAGLEPIKIDPDAYVVTCAE